MAAGSGACEPDRRSGGGEADPLPPHAGPERRQSRRDRRFIFDTNPDWPLPTLLKPPASGGNRGRTGQYDGRRSLHGKETHPDAVTRAALLRCADALADVGRGKEAGPLAREAWVIAISDATTEALFLRRFPGLISNADQWARFQRLAWDDSAGAQRQIAPTSTWSRPAKRSDAAGAENQRHIGDTARPDE